jgi:predicted PurR-regulated permease PerM
MNISLGSAGVWLHKLFNSVRSGASTLLFAVIFAIYFLLDDKIFKYWAGVLHVFVSDETSEKLRHFSADANKVFSGYIRGQSTDAAIVGLLVSFALLIAGIPYAVVIGILTGLGNLVPYGGPVVGFGSLIIVCLPEGSLSHLAIGGVILAAVMFIDGNIINPRMLSSNVEVHPVLVIIALIAGGKVGGVVGMLVAVPVAALLKLQFEKQVEKRKAKLS